ncbi:hypothetical protein CU098_011330, partial [Rhizopus stolonifer]
LELPVELHTIDIRNHQMSWKLKRLGRSASLNEEHQKHLEEKFIDRPSPVFQTESN